MLKWFRSLLGGGGPGIGIGALEASTLHRDGAILLDVRSKAERQGSMIPGSRHVPLDQLASQMNQLPQGKIIVCQCASGHRSGVAAHQLKAQGYDARSLTGGITAWKNAGLPVKKG